jgi:hypothetical protein
LNRPKSGARGPSTCLIDDDDNSNNNKRKKKKNIHHSDDPNTGTPDTCAL